LPSQPYVPDYSPEPSPNDSRKRLLLALGLLVLVIACLAVTVSGYNLARGRLAALRSEPSPTLPEADPTATGIPAAAVSNTPLPLPSATSLPSPTSTLTPTASPQPSPTLELVPPECEQGYLFAAGRVFAILILPPSTDGALRLPQGDPDAAYFLDGSAQPGSGAGYAFFLSDTPENQALLGSDQVGSPVSILWRGCILEETMLLGIQPASAAQPPTYDPYLPGLTMFVIESVSDTQALLPQLTAPLPTRKPSAGTQVGPAHRS
jgi:hypothetical protein